MPLFVATLATVGWLVARAKLGNPGGPDALLAFGWMAWLAWVVQSPIAHLRYAWPSLASFISVGTLALVTLLRTSSVAPVGALAVGLAFLLAGYLDGGRLVLHGESDAFSWEWSR